MKTMYYGYSIPCNPHWDKHDALLLTLMELKSSGRFTQTASMSSTDGNMRKTKRESKKAKSFVIHTFENGVKRELSNNMDMYNKNRKFVVLLEVSRGTFNVYFRIFLLFLIIALWNHPLFAFNGVSVHAPWIDVKHRKSKKKKKEMFILFSAFPSR